jgi:hypothetical protein
VGQSVSEPWRAHVAPALAMAGRGGQALEVIGPAVEHARSIGAPWALGDGAAHALLELGATLRRKNAEPRHKSTCVPRCAADVGDPAPARGFRDRTVVSREPVGIVGIVGIVAEDA